MRNNFVVSLTRFHMSDPNRYVLQGYFEGNTAEGSRITAQLDGVSLQVETGAREGLGIRQKYFSRGIGYENIDREYDLWISLPSGWESGKRLRVFQETESEGQAEKERRCIFRVGTGQLKKERRMTDGYLETFWVENGKVYIGGWAVGDERCRFKVTDGEAFENARLLASHEGIFAGSSSGAALAAVRKLVDGGAKGTIVTVFPDRGDRYFSKGLYTGAID